MKIRQGKSEVCVHKLRDAKLPGDVMLHEWDYDDFVADDNVVRNYLSFTGVLYHAANDTVYCGTTSFANDLLYAFDRATKSFTSVGYEKIANKFEAKIHRALEHGRDGMIYFGTAQLHDPNHWMEYPGGCIVRLDPSTNKLEQLCRPVEHCPVQSMTIDNERNIIYGVTYMPEMLFRYDIGTNKSRVLSMTGTSNKMIGPHRPAVDDAGKVWAAWGSGYADTFVRLLRYNPETEEITWFRHGVPKADENDLGTIDCMLNGKDGFIYVGSAIGLSRVDPESGDIEVVGKPYEGDRLSGLEVGPDGCIYGMGGKHFKFRAFSFDPKNGEFTDYGPVHDDENDTDPFVIHDITVTDDRVIYGGEIDNMYRSPYLWECRVG